MFGKRPLSADDGPAVPAGSGLSANQAPSLDQGDGPARQALAPPPKSTPPNPPSLEATTAKMRAATERLRVQSAGKSPSLIDGTAPSDPAAVERSQYYQATKSLIFSALITTIDLPELAQMSATVAAD